MRRSSLLVRTLMVFAVVGLCFSGSAGSAAKKGKGGGGGGGGGGTPQPRVIEFAGYQWTVKSGSSPLGPGPNLFSDSTESVWVDEQGQLHLKIRKQRKAWYCAEVICNQSFGYGSYDFYLNSRVDQLDPNVVLGLFTWSDDPAFNHREIDIEFARWGNTTDVTNAQYVVQPYYLADHLFRFVQPSIDRSTHSFTWKVNDINFMSLTGHRSFADSPAQVISSAIYEGNNVPLPGDENPRMNLWLMGGNSPTDRNSVEVIVSDFVFRPAP